MARRRRKPPNPVVAEIRAGARRNRATPMEEKSAYETGIVESGLRNLRGGDADSEGWRQERASLYPNPTNLRASVDRYFQEAKARRGKFGTAGALAAAVQRPAAQYRGRYQQVSGQADELLRHRYADAYGLPASSSLRTVTTERPTLDEKGYRLALGKAMLAKMIAKRNPGSSLLTSGVLSTADPSLEDFKGSVLERTKQRVPGSAGTPLARGGRAAGVTRGRTGKIIGVPYQGTHNLGNWQSDNAIDEAVPVGTILTVPRDAVVEKVKGSYAGGASRFDGYQVTVRLADGNRLFYTHLSKAHVRAGDKLRRGQAIGRSGAANGVAHLHLGAEKGDPRKYVRRKGAR